MPDFVAGSGENGGNNESDNYEYGDKYVTGKSTSDCAIGISGNGVCLQEKINQANSMVVRSTKGNSKREEDRIPLWNRYSLSIPEAAKYFGIGETRIYQIVAEHPGADFILEIGSHVKIKRVLFERFLDAASCV